jgi:hypothetical protein
MSREQTPDDIKQLFIDEFEKHGIVAPACKAAGIHYHAYRHWLATDEGFCEAVENARAVAADTIENEIYRRAILGVEREKVIGSGESARFITEKHYSDALAAKLLDGAKPEKYAARSKAEISTPEGKSLQISDTTSAARIAAILEGVKIRLAGTVEIDPLS